MCIRDSRGACTTCTGMSSSGVGIGFATGCLEVWTPTCMMQRTWQRRANTETYHACAGAVVGPIKDGRADRRFGCVSSPSGGMITSDFASSPSDHQLELTETMKRHRGHELSRRQFLRRAGASVALFNILPGTVLHGADTLSPNAKLNVAGIGIGSRGGAIVGEAAGLGHNVVALCDVDEKYAAK